MKIQDELTPIQLDKDTVKSIRQTIQNAPSINEALTSVRKTLEFENAHGIAIDGNQIVVHTHGTEYRWDYNKTVKIDSIDL